MRINKLHWNWQLAAHEVGHIPLFNSTFINNIVTVISWEEEKYILFQLYGQRVHILAVSIVTRVFA